MKKFKCEVTIKSKYIIEIDDEALGDEFIDGYKQSFADYDEWYEHAENIAVQKARGFDFIEGYGVPTVKGSRPPFTKDEDVEHAINIVPIYEEEIEVESDEI